MGERMSLPPQVVEVLRHVEMKADITEAVFGSPGVRLSMPPE